MIFCAFFPIFFAINSVLCVDRNESVYSILSSFISGIVYVKFLYLLFKKQEILDFLYDPIMSHSTDDQKEFEQTNKKIQKLMKFIRLYSVAICTTSIVVIIVKLPIFSADGGLPYFISFSWNDSKIVYWLVFLLIALLSPVMATNNLSTSIIWFIALNYSIEYELLGNKLRKLGTGTKSIEAKGNNQDIVSLTTRRRNDAEALVDFIKAHRNLSQFVLARSSQLISELKNLFFQICRTVERFKTCFSTLFFGQIITSGICICTSVYSISFVSKL